MEGIDVEERGLRLVEFFGLSMLSGDPHEVAAWLVEGAKLPRAGGTIVSHINANNFYWLERHPEWRDRLRAECVLVLDGVGAQCAAFLQGHGWLPNLNGTDLFPLVLRGAASAGLRVFLLGGRPDVAARAAWATRRRFPGVRVVGHEAGYFAPAAERLVVARVRQSRPDILLVGRGFLRQERFALEHRDELRVPLIWNVGGLFDFVSGDKPRAPALVRRMRLEWAFRFLLSPRAMWHRNLVAGPWFVTHVLRHAGRARTDAARAWRPFARPRTSHETVHGGAWPGRFAGGWPAREGPDA